MKTQQPSWFLRHKQCAYCRQLLPVDQFYLDRSERDGLARVCSECENTRPYRDYRMKWGHELSVQTELMLPCTWCGKVKPESGFYREPKANLNNARHGRRAFCKECQSSGKRSPHPNRWRGMPKLVGSGVRVSAGNGVISQAKPLDQEEAATTLALRTMAEYEAEAAAAEESIEAEEAPVPISVAVPEPKWTPAREFTMQEWYDLDQVPSVFVAGRVALMLCRHGEHKAVDILTTSGDGPDEAVSPKLTDYIIKLLTGEKVSDLYGTIYY